MEEWKDIKGYEGLYQISNYGNCKSLDRTIIRMSRWRTNINVTYKGKQLNPNKVGNGYYRFDLCKNGDYTHKYVHHLVWETFMGEIPEGYEIDHINTIKSDNRIENLRLVDRKTNMQNPITYKRRIKSIIQIDKTTNEIIKQFPSVKDAKKAGFKHADAVARGDRKQDKGYIFKYY